MQTIFYSPNKASRNQIYRGRINHTLYSSKEFDINYQPINDYLPILYNHDLVIVSDRADWVRIQIKKFNQYKIKYRLINESKEYFDDSKNTIDVTETSDLTSLVYYEQFIKPNLYVGLTRNNYHTILHNANSTNYTFMPIVGNLYTDLNKVPLLTKLTKRFIHLKTSIVLPCNNPASFLADSTHRLCLLANPSSINPLTRVYNLEKQKWIDVKFNQKDGVLPLVRLTAEQLNREFKTGKYTIYAVELGVL